MFVGAGTLEITVAKGASHFQCNNRRETWLTVRCWNCRLQKYEYYLLGEAKVAVPSVLVVQLQA